VVARAAGECATSDTEDEGECAALIACDLGALVVARAGEGDANDVRSVVAFGAPSCVA
jgi:hypothetical protein